jgi:hypothetical protein
MKMKPNEIKKELETAMKLGDAPIGKNFGCIISKLTAKETLAYIEQLEAKVEMLNNECRETRRDLLNEIIRLEDQLETAKSEAVKEFAERLKEEKCHYTETEHTFDFDGVTVEDIDNVKKEMVGDNK